MSINKKAPVVATGAFLFTGQRVIRESYLQGIFLYLFFYKKNNP